MALNLKLANNAKGTLAAAINASAVTIQLAAGQGANFPTITTGEDFFTVTATTLAGDHEIMYVTARAFDVLTVLRGQENTLARSYAAGTIVENRLTAGTLLGQFGTLKTLINTAISTFDPGPGTELTTANVKSVLLGALTLTELSGGLAGTIAKIDGAVSQIGSVNQRIKVETDNRVAAIQNAIDIATNFHNAEVGDRIAYVNSFTYSKNGIDTAIAFQANVTQTAYTAYADTAKTQAVALAAADVRNYTFSQSGITSALAQQSSIITAAYTAYADAKKGEAISTASADVRNYSYSQAQVNGAIAASATQLRSEFVSSGGATEGYVSNYAYSKSQIDSSEAAQTSAITTSYQNYATAKKGEAITAAAADVRTYAYSQAAVDSAIASTNSAINTSYNNAVAAAASYVQNYTFSQSAISGALAAQSTTLTTNYQNYANARKGEAITAAAADVRAFTYSQASIDGSFSSQTNTLTANYKQYADAKKAEAISAASADVRSYTYAASTIDGAIASSSNSVNARLNNAGGAGVTVESKLSATASAVTGLQGQASLTVDVNGVVTGVKATASSSASNLVFNASNVLFSAPGVTPRNLFGSGTVNGATRMVVLGDAIVDGGITARALRVGSPDNAITDSNIDDLNWWGLSGIATTIDYQGIPSGWKSRRTLKFSAGLSWVDVTSQYFPMTPGGSYFSEYSILLSNDFVGNISLVTHLPAQQFFAMGGPSRGYSWPSNQGGLPVNFDENSPKGFFTFSAPFTLNSTTYQNRAQIRLTIQVSAGYVEIGGMSITRTSDTTLIKDGSITTGKLTAGCVTTDNLIANGVSDIDRFTGVSSAVFGAPRDFKCLLKVTTDPVVQDGVVVSAAHWVLERYYQGNGNSLFIPVFEVGVAEYDDLITLSMSTADYPYYRIRMTGGSSMNIRILKVYR